MKKKTAAKKLPAEAFDRIPRVTITLTDESIYLTRHNRAGAPVATYPVDAADVANAFNQFGANTGLLPENVLFWQSINAILRIGIYLPPSKRTIHIGVGRGVQTWKIPLPGLMFIGCGIEYVIYAVKERPVSDRMVLYHAPLPNVYADGRICAGSVKFPKCDAGTIGQAAALFFESGFNRDLVGKETIGLLKSLRGKSKFPIEKLEPVDQLAGDAIRRDDRDDDVLVDEPDDYGEED
jgi:PRTRC genetic system protein B